MEIEENSKGKDEPFAAAGLYALLLCASFAGWFADNEKVAIAVSGAARLSPLHLRKRLFALAACR